MLYRLNLKLNSNQGLALARQKQILRSTRHKNLSNQNNQDSFRKYNVIYIMIYNMRVVSRANYFRKTGGCAKSEACKYGHKIFKITK